jgi:hypothetical protein
MLFNSYAEAHAASDWFGMPSEFDFSGPSLPPGYVIEDGMVVWSDGGPDATFALRFIVSGSLRIVQNGLWEVYVPFYEVTE